MLLASVFVGDKFSEDYPRWLLRQVRSFGQTLLLTDRKERYGWERIKRIPDEGWWSKLQLFALDESILFFDLDSLVVGDLTPFWNYGGVTGCRDWVRGGFNSSVMKIDPRSPEAKQVREALPHPTEGGDQEWIAGHTQVRYFPAYYVQSYKVLMGKYRVHPNADPHGRLPKVVEFHGTPKPHELGFMKALHGYC